MPRHDWMEEKFCSITKHIKENTNIEIINKEVEEIEKDAAEKIRGKIMTLISKCYKNVARKVERIDFAGGP